MNEEEILELAKERFARAADAESENRTQALEDIRFENGDQWPESILRDRRAENRPALVINRVPAFVRQVVNDIRQIRPAIKVRPVDNQADPRTAEVLNGMIRAIEQSSNAEGAYDWGSEHSVKGGFGFWRIKTDYETETGFEQCIEIERIHNQFSVYFDPDAEQADGSDAKWCLIVEYRDRKAFEDEYGDDTGEWEHGLEGDDYDDWQTEDKVRIAEYWCIEEKPQTITLMSDGSTVPGEVSEEDVQRLYMAGMPIPQVGPDGKQITRKTKIRTVYSRLITGMKVLEETVWPGKYIPIVRVLGEESVIDGEVCYKGMVRDLRDPQRQYNYMRSASVERIALAPKAPYIGPEGSFVSPKWRRANIKNYPYLEYKPVPGAPPPGRESPPEMSSGLVSEVQHAAEELKAVSGIYDPAMGARSNETAGVAINARKLESDVSNFHYVDNLARAIRYTGKVLVDLIPKIYTDQRMFNILGVDGTEERVQLNSDYIDDQGRPQSIQLGRGRYDVVVDVGPSFTTQRQEAKESMLEIAKTFPAAAPIMGDLLANAMDWPGADEIAKRLKMLLPPEILKGESPHIANLIQQHQTEKQMGMQLIEQLQDQIKALATELQKEREKRQIDLMKIQEDARQADMSHVEGMTKLELEAGRDISQAGQAF